MSGNDPIKWSLDSLEGAPDPDGDQAGGLRGHLRRVFPGVSVAALVALAAAWLSDHYTAPIMLFALLLGMAMNFVRHDPLFRRGLDFATRDILRAGVALLGLRITLDQVLVLGPGVVLLVSSGVVVTMLAGRMIAKALRLQSDFGLLTGGAVAICGASAALAISAALPPSPSRERDTLLTVVGVTALSTLAMVIYPLLSALLGFSELQAGVLLGGTIHDVAQVVGAGYGISDEVGDTATIVKLLRVALLVPTIVVLTLMFRVRSSDQKLLGRAPILPWFLVGFVALAAIGTMGWLPAPFVHFGEDASRALLVCAIGAVGAKTSFGDLFKVGTAPILLIVLESAVILAWITSWVALG
ncbi:MAG: putative sulfate exporter family transporter [Alphaproteobacteria bacterium]|nr:putative sulfate exporter family transporter [Alphaproteobacteria bacterium]